MRGAGSRHANQLLIHKFTDAKIRELAAVSGVFHSAEWQIGRRPRCLIDKNHARFNLARESFASLIASISSLTRKISATGAKNSWRKAGFSGVMSVRMVGCKKYPGRSSRLPPS